MLFGVVRVQGEVECSRRLELLRKRELVQECCLSVKEGSELFKNRSVLFFWSETLYVAWLIIKNLYFIYVYGYFASKCVPHRCSACRGQKRVLDSLELELEMIVSLHVWESNLGPLEDQLVLLNFEPSFQFLGLVFVIPSLSHAGEVRTL